jgi:membrane-bound ClpP family serine protease
MTKTDLDSQLSSDRIVENLLDQKLADIESAFGRVDALAFLGPLTSSADTLVRIALEQVSKRRPGLLVLLETDGGYIEVVERIVNTLRHYYKRVDFLIPDHAMSAGTVLAMSGDAIHMDYFSILGPIDPQVQRPGSQAAIPVQGYLARYQALLEKAQQGIITTAELNILVSCFDQAEIYKFEQAVELSVTLLKQWLVKHKFKNWRQTEKTGLKVTRKMKEERAEEIARALNDVARWHTHARGIPMSVLQRDLNLKIDDFGKRQALSNAVKAYITLLADYRVRTGQVSVVHSKGFYFAV